MFNIGDEVQLTEDSCEYYEDSDPSLYDLCGIPLAVTDVDTDECGVQLVGVLVGKERFSFYEFELELA